MSVCALTPPVAVPDDRPPVLLIRYTPVLSPATQSFYAEESEEGTKLVGHNRHVHVVKSYICVYVFKSYM